MCAPKMCPTGHYFILHKVLLLLHLGPISLMLLRAFKPDFEL